LPAASDAIASAMLVFPAPFGPMITVTPAASGTSARAKQRTFSRTSRAKPAPPERGAE
jgi:hypothetical protein